MSKTITGVMPIRTVGLTPGHRWCGGLRSVKSVVNNGKGAPGLVQGPSSLNASYTHPGRISGTPRKLARDLRNRHLATWPTEGLQPQARRETYGPADGGVWRPAPNRRLCVAPRSASRRLKIALK